MTAQPGGWKNYRFPILILTGVVVGAIVGLIMGESATVLKPFGTVFINMMFTLVVPMVFFSIASAVANMNSATRLGRIMGSMMAVFIATGIVASSVMLLALGFSARSTTCRSAWTKCLKSRKNCPLAIRSWVPSRWRTSAT